MQKPVEKPIKFVKNLETKGKSYPVTHVSAVIDDENKSIGQLIANLKKGQTLIETTSEELKTQKDNGELLVGSLYRLTDVDGSAFLPDSPYYGKQLDVVLLATSPNTLAEEGWAMMYDNIYDVTFADGVTKKCYWYTFYDENNRLSVNLVRQDTLLGETLGGIEEALGTYIIIDEDKKTIVFVPETQFTIDALNVENLTYNDFQDTNLSAWKVWYSLDNDNKGTIYSVEEGPNLNINAITTKEIDDIISGATNSNVPVSLSGLVSVPDNTGGPAANGKFSVDFSTGTHVIDYPSTADRASFVIPISDKFPEMPSDKLYSQSAYADEYEQDFVINTVFKKYTFIQFKDIDKVYWKLTSNSKVQSYSMGFGGYKDLINGKILDTAIKNWSWNSNTTPEVFMIKTNGTDYTPEKEYCMCGNFKKTNNSNFTAPEYRTDFDIILFPNNWNVKKLLDQRSFQSYFPNGGNRWAGGMVIYNDIMIQLYTSGKILILNKNTYDVIAVGEMDVASENMHCNAVSFGTTIPSGSTVPYLYVSQWTSGACDCHVMKLTWTNGVVTCTRVQKISYTGSKFNSNLNWDWSVDAKKGYLWCYGYSASASDRFGSKTCLKYAIPSLSSSTVTLNDTNILAEKTFTFAGLMQDTHIENDVMFYEFGYNNTGYFGGILIIDLSTSTPTLYNDNIISMVDTELELEGIARDGNKLIVTTHKPDVNTFDFGVYEIDLLQNNMNNTNDKDMTVVTKDELNYFWQKVKNYINNK